MRGGALAPAALAAVLCGCARRPPPTTGSWAHCVCTFLTDYDDDAHIELDVCVPAGRDLMSEATSCAAESAHNHVDGCRCDPFAGPCTPGAQASCRTR